METTGKEIDMQREMPFFADLPDPEFLPDHLIETCNSFGDALSLCIQYSRLSYEAISNRSGINPPTISKMLKGSAGIKRKQLETIQRICGNYAIAQFFARDAGCHLVRTTDDEELQELKKRIAIIEGKRVA